MECAYSPCKKIVGMLHYHRLDQPVASHLIPKTWKRGNVEITLMLRNSVFFVSRVPLNKVAMTISLIVVHITPMLSRLEKHHRSGSYCDLKILTNKTKIWHTWLSYLVEQVKPCGALHLKHFKITIYSWTGLIYIYMFH